MQDLTTISALLVVSASLAVFEKNEESGFVTVMKNQGQIIYCR